MIVIFIVILIENETTDDADESRWEQMGADGSRWEQIGADGMNSHKMHKNTKFLIPNS